MLPKDVRFANRTAVGLAALTALGLVARLAWSHWTAATPPFLSDPEYYNATALSLARGHGFTVTFDGEQGFIPGGDPTAFWPPGFPMLLAAAYGLFGETLAVARTLNAIAGALTIVPIYFIGRRLFGPSAGLMGASLATLVPSLVFWTPVLFSETIFTFLFACALALLLYAIGPTYKLQPMQLVLAGLVIGLAVLVRGQALLLLPVAAGWAVLVGAGPGSALRLLAIMSLLAAVVLGPWAVRNVVVMDSPIALSANFGYNLRIGHAPYSTGRYIVPQDLWDAQPGLSFHERETLFNELGRERAVQYAIQHPGRELSLSGKKIIALWRPDSDALKWVTSFGQNPLPAGYWEPLRIVSDTTYLTIVAAAGAALFLLQEKRGVAFVAALIGLWTCMHVAFFGEPRFHLPMLVVIVPMAGSAFATLAGRIRGWYASGLRVQGGRKAEHGEEHAV